MSETKLNPSGRDDYIRLLSSEGYSSELIRKTLKKYQINTSKATISRVLNKVTKNCKKTAGIVVSPYKRRLNRVRTENNIKFVDNETEKENALTHNSMAKILKCSLQSIGDIINKDLNKKIKKKN